MTGMSGKIGISLFDTERVGTPKAVVDYIAEAIEELKWRQEAVEAEEKNREHRVITVTDENRAEVQTLAREKQLIIVHGYYKPTEFERVNLSHTTFLCDPSHTMRSRLLYSDGMAIEPAETEVACLETLRFTLYFKKLPEECKKFCLWENTYEPFPFYSEFIERGQREEYELEVDLAPF
jgi:hypothetical protein